MNALLTAIFTVFTQIGNWITETIPMFFKLFYVSEGSEAGLTFLGTLAVVSLGIGIVFLLIGIIQRFLKFRA